MTNKDETDLQAKLRKAEKQAKQEQQEQQENQENQEIEKLKKDLEEMTEHAKRTMADLQNLRKRQEEERNFIIQLANTELIKNLLPVLDNLNRAKENTKTNLDEDLSEWVKGIEMSITQLHETLKKAGLTEIEALGTAFNPDLHEALLEDKGEKDIVIEELEKGYMVGNRVIRHSKVKVGNGE